MKRIQWILLILVLLAAAVTCYFIFYTQGGADGLSNFIPAALSGVLFICFFLALLLSLALRKGQSVGVRILIFGIVLALPMIGLFSVMGVFTWFTKDYENGFREMVELDKTVLENKRFTDSDFEISFDHVSGRVSEYRSGVPIPVPITPYKEDGILYVPVDNETYHRPDVLLKYDGSFDGSLSEFTASLKIEINKPNLAFSKVSSGMFPKLSNMEVLSLDKKESAKEKLKLAQHFIPEQDDFVHTLYFIKSKEKVAPVWVLVIVDEMLSPPALVEDMSIANREKQNFWYNTLEFMD